MLQQSTPECPILLNFQIYRQVVVAVSKKHLPSTTKMLRSCSMPLRCRIVVISDPLPGCPGVTCTLHSNSSKKRSTCLKYRCTALMLHCPSARFSRSPPSVVIALVSIQASPPPRLLLGVSTKTCVVW
jgi:hypothetical protein